MKKPQLSGVLLLTLVQAAAIPASLQAQIADFTSELEIRHRTSKGKVDVKFGDREELGHDATKPIKVKARINENVSVIIKDPNTLLFEYKPGERSEKATADYEALSKFVGSFIGEIQLSSKGGGGGPLAATSPSIVVGSQRITFQEARGSLVTLSAFIGKIQRLVDATISGGPSPDIPSSEEVEAIDLAAKLAAVLDEVATNVTSDEQSVQFISARSNNKIEERWTATLAIQIQPEGVPSAPRQPAADASASPSQESLPTASEILQDAAKEVAKSIAEELRAQATVLEKARVSKNVANKQYDDAITAAGTASSDTTQEELKRLTDRTEKLGKNLTELSINFIKLERSFSAKALELTTAQENHKRAIAKAPSPAPAKLAETPQPPDKADMLKARNFLAKAFLVRNEIKSNIALAKKFASDYQAYRIAFKDGVRVAEITPNNQKDITQKIEITPVKAGYSKGSELTEHQQTFSGSFSVELAAQQSFHFRGGAGVIYSFIKNPEYSVATSASGAMTIAEKNSSSNALSAAATLNIYPDRYFGEALEPFLQIGYSPIKDVQGFMLGAGGTFYGTTQISGGVIYQQRRTLSAGQSVGAQLTKAEDLRVEKEFKPGIYLQVSVPIPFTK